MTSPAPEAPIRTAEEMLEAVLALPKIEEEHCYDSIMVFQIRDLARRLAPPDSGNEELRARIEWYRANPDALDDDLLDALLRDCLAALTTASPVRVDVEGLVALVPCTCQQPIPQPPGHYGNCAKNEVRTFRTPHPSPAPADRTLHVSKPQTDYPNVVVEVGAAAPVPVEPDAQATFDRLENEGRLRARLAPPADLPPVAAIPREPPDPAPAEKEKV